MCHFSEARGSLGPVALLRVGTEGSGEEAGREKTSAHFHTAPTAGSLGHCGLFSVCAARAACTNTLLTNQLTAQQHFHVENSFFVGKARVKAMRLRAFLLLPGIHSGSLREEWWATKICGGPYSMYTQMCILSTFNLMEVCSQG